MIAVGQMTSRLLNIVQRDLSIKKCQPRKHALDTCLNSWKIKAIIGLGILLKFKPKGMRNGLNKKQEKIDLAWAKTNMKVSYDQESEDRRLPHRTMQMKGGICQRAPAFHDPLGSFYLFIIYF